MEVNNKVICVDDTIRPEMMLSVAKYYSNWVVRDKVYTIREVLHNEGIVEGVLLNEIKNDPIYIDIIDKKQEPAFGMFRFKLFQDSFMEENVEHYVEML